MKIKTFGYLALISGILIAASTPIAYTLGNNISAIQLMLFVSLVGTIASGLVMFGTNTQKNISGILQNKTQLLTLTTTGLLMFTILTLIFSIATHHISAALVSVVYRTWPLMLIAIAPFVMAEKASRWDVLALIVGFASLAIVLIGNTPISLPVIAIPFVALVLIAAFCDASASALQKRYSYEIYSSTFIYNLTALIAFTALALYFNEFTILGLTTTDLYVILFLGLIQNVGLTFAYVNAMRTLKTSFVGNMYNLAPFLTMILGVVILGQAIQPAYIVIALGVLAGITIQRLAPRATHYINKSKASEITSPTIYDVTSAFVNTKNRKIYDVMKGSGRVLAFFTKKYNGNHQKISDYGNESCMLMTNKANSGQVAPDELEFIKEILGHDENDLLVLGVGQPEDVEQRFSEIHKMI